MNPRLSEIVRRVLSEDTDFGNMRAGAVPLESPPGGGFRRSSTGSSGVSDSDFSGEDATGEEIEVSGPNKSNKLLGSVTPNWGGDYATGAKSHRKRPLGNWESDNAWDVHARPGTSVYSLTSGRVSLVRRAKPGNPLIFGDMIIVSGATGFPDMYYTHVKSSVAQGQQLSQGDMIGVILDPASSGSKAEMPPHVHIGMNDGTYKSDKANPKQSSGGGSISRVVREDGTILGPKGGPMVASAEPPSKG